MNFKLWLENNAKLYHGSRKKFPIGFILKPQSDGYVHEEQNVEDFVEKYRPKNLLSRRDCVFLVNDPEEIEYAGGYADNIYQVEPMGQLEKSDLAWYSEVSIYLDDENEIEPMIQAAKNYWAGTPHYNRSQKSREIWV